MLVAYVSSVTCGQTDVTYVRVLHDAKSAATQIFSLLDMLLTIKIPTQKNSSEVNFVQVIYIMCEA
jgi:hypothetical protein